MDFDMYIKELKVYKILFSTLFCSYVVFVTMYVLFIL